MDHWHVIIIGAGPAGLMAACRAAERGRTVLLLEKNSKPGSKILISGGGHCNLTHATDARGIVAAFGTAGRFLHSALAALDPAGLVELMAAEGVPCRTEPDGKILPTSDRASDVLAALMRRLRRSGATLAVGEALVEIERRDSGFRLVTSTREISADKIVLATGGKSYPGCGTTGDGYRWAAALGHAIVRPRPALVPILTDESWVKELQGITLPDVQLRVVPIEGESNPPGAMGGLPALACAPGGSGRQAAAGTPAKRSRSTVTCRGSLLFAHFGLSGPVALDISREISDAPRSRRPTLVCNLLPEVSQMQLDGILTAASSQTGRRRVASLLEPWLPRRVAEALTAQAEIAPDRRAAELARPERSRLIEKIKQLRIRATGTLGFEKAEVTAGGVSLAEVDSRTMESKLMPGLFLAGELLDLDGPIGGYNLQAAFSTGYLAGESV
jgi:predicted flavoprotein YhiN